MTSGNGAERILVTGGAGYLGSTLVPMLLEAGYSVTVVDNFRYGQSSLLDVCHRKELTILRGDVRDRALMTEQVKRADLIIPLACMTGAPICEMFPQEARSVNLDAIRLLLELRSRDQRILFPTTNSGYGVGQEGIHCTEETPLRPVSHYGRLKVEAERILLEAGNSLTFRLATAFGISPRMRLDLLVNDFVYRAVTDGFVILFQAHFKRNFVHVRDIGGVFLHAIRHFDAMKGQTYNVGLSDANLSKRELCERIQKRLPRFYFSEAAVGEDPDIRNYIVSNAKIEAAGYRTRVSLDEGIEELIKGYAVIRRKGHGNV